MGDRAVPFFIVGNDRSGTTMLRLILDRGAEVAIPPESMFLGDFAAVRTGKIDLSSHDAATRFARNVWEHPKVALWNLDGDAPVPAQGLSHADTYRFSVEAPYRAYARQHGKRRWGDKTPYYVLHIPEILGVWPDAKFVVLVRDGRDVALSVQKMPFGANNAFAAAETWAEGIRRGMRAQRQHPDNVLSVRYEDLVSNPEPHVRRVASFLGLTYTADMLRVEDTPKDKIVADQAAWFTNLWAGINEKSVGKWRREMSERDQRVFAAVAGPELAAWGYDLGEHVDGPLPVLGVAATRYRLQNSSRRAVNFVKLRLVQERGRELRYVARRKLKRQ